MRRLWCAPITTLPTLKGIHPRPAGRAGAAAAHLASGSTWGLGSPIFRAVLRASPKDVAFNFLKIGRMRTCHRALALTRAGHQQHMRMPRIESGGMADAMKRPISASTSTMVVSALADLTSFAPRNVQSIARIARRRAQNLREA